jgi:2-C-methyl-D-erythritol 2,4-cyclodiphosphate synthase
VLLHALVDALLGAVGLGDIGEWFPDTADEWRDADSAMLLTSVVREVTGRGWRVGNVDAIVFAERPKLADHKPAIRARVAELLAIEPARVNIKAKTGEQVGSIGRREAIAAEVVVLLERA